MVLFGPLSKNFEFGLLLESKNWDSQKVKGKKLL